MRPLAKSILERVSAAHHVPVAAILGPSRKRTVMLARREAMVLMRREAGYSYLAIAAEIGRDHTTVIHALRRFDGA